MQINWFTLVVQIINFLALVYLLRRFLYRPVVEAMDRRKAALTARLQEAEDKRRQAEQEEQRHRQARQALEEERAAILARAEAEAEARRRELLHQAEQEAREVDAGWREAMRREKADFLEELRQRAAHETLAVARRALADLADARLEQQMAEAAVRQLQGLSPADRQALADSIRRSGGHVTVRAAFDLGDDARCRLLDAVRDGLCPDEPLDARFERSGDLLCGVQVQADGRQVGWSITQYLTALEARLDEVFDGPLGVQEEQHEHQAVH